MKQKIQELDAAGITKGEGSEHFWVTFFQEVKEEYIVKQDLDELDKNDDEKRQARLLQHILDTAERFFTKGKEVEYYRFDELTKLEGRKDLWKTLDEHVSPKEKKDGPGYLLYALIDLDDFKPINDTYGHPAGDQVFKEIGRRMREFSRRKANSQKLNFFRIGGDEFVLLAEMPSNVKEDGIRMLREIIEAVFSKEINVIDKDNQTQHLRLRCSIGFDFISSTTKRSVDAIASEVDIAQYSSKKRKAEIPSSERIYPASKGTGALHEKASAYVQ